MGVYDHMMRPSMGHRMQVDLRDSMLRYHSDKTLLQQQFSQLCLDSKKLHTSPLPASPLPSLKRWADPDSKFNKAPEMAAQKARQAKLEQEKKETKDKELRVQGTLLPPLEDRSKDSKENAGRSDQEADSKKKPSGGDKPAQNKKHPHLRGSKVGKKALPKKAEAEAKANPLPMPLIKLPTIHSANFKKSMWDSGRNHIHPVGKSTQLEKNQVDEECRMFSHSTVTIPPIMDSRRLEIKMAVQAKQPSSKVKFTRAHSFAFPAPVAAPVAAPAPAPAPAPTKPVVTTTKSPPANGSVKEESIPTQDHFPKVDKRLPELEDTSSVGSFEEEEMHSVPVAAEDSDPLRLPPLPVVRLSESETAPHTLQATTYHVPRLHLDQGRSPSAMSMATGRSGATYMSQVSQETQEWKGVYMAADNPHQKSRMLTEILHAVRQRMYDNEQDLRLQGEDPRPHDEWSIGGRSDVMLLHRHEENSSGANTSRTKHNLKPFKLPSNRKKAMGRAHPSQSSKLHSYLTKMSFKRKTMEGRHTDRGTFHVANMPIREITQTSIEPNSTVHTAQTAT